VDNYENHLWPLIYDQYNHGRHEKELEFYYKEFKHRTGKVLETACGTGMIFLKLLSRGIDIYGLDISEPMLDILLKKASDMGLSKAKKRVTAQNMIDFKYDMKFDHIFIPARSFLHLSNQDEQIKCLKNIYSHLNNGGRFLINFLIPI
jgi:ubiquinone/menaquinone biosynthesis C-methylase UbiE